MNIFPFESVTYESHLSETEIKKRLSGVLKSSRNRNMNTGNKGLQSYDGYLSENNFEIRRKINYQNSFLPLIKGEFIQASNKVTIKIKMRLQILVIIFMSIWCGITFSIFVGLFISDVIDNKPFDNTLMPLGMLVFGYIITVVGFKIESYIAKKDLKKIFESDAL